MTISDIHLMDFSCIRPMKREEIPVCVEVIRRGFVTVAQEFGFTKEGSPKFTGFSINEERLYYQYDIEKRPMFVYELDGQIVGYYSQSLPENNRIELNNLAVLPEVRHHSIGKTMIEHCRRTAKAAGNDSILVCIVEENKRLRKWYESLGFVHFDVKELPGYEFHCGYLVKYI